MERNAVPHRNKNTFPPFAKQTFSSGRTRRPLSSGPGSVCTCHLDFMDNMTLHSTGSESTCEKGPAFQMPCLLIFIHYLLPLVCDRLKSAHPARLRALVPSTSSCRSSCCVWVVCSVLCWILRFLCLDLVAPFALYFIMSTRACVSSCMLGYHAKGFGMSYLWCFASHVRVVHLFLREHRGRW